MAPSSVFLRPFKPHFTTEPRFDHLGLLWEVPWRIRSQPIFCSSKTRFLISNLSPTTTLAFRHAHHR